MGSWIHGARDPPTQVNFGPDAHRGPLEWRLEWYDPWLKGLQSKVTRKEAPFSSAVRIFVMGTGSGAKDGQGLLDHGGYWRDEPEWPLARAVVTAFHLQPGGGLATEAPPQDGGATSFVFEPRNPVPTIGGQTSSGNDILVQGARDQRGGEHVWNWQKPVPLSARNDVLVFQTAALPEDIEVTGELEVNCGFLLGADTRFHGETVDVYPPAAIIPTDFDLLSATASFPHNGFALVQKEEKLMEPGGLSGPDRLYPTSNVLRGPRIRVDISSSNFPRFDVTRTQRAAESRPARTGGGQQCEHNAAHPSASLLPLCAGHRRLNALARNAIGHEIWAPVPHSGPRKQGLNIRRWRNMAGHRETAGILAVLGLCWLALQAVAGESDAQGPYQPEWPSLMPHSEAPDWFRDAKFGIYFHWGVYCVPAFGSEWYIRDMHLTTSPSSRHHVETYGEPSESLPRLRSHFKAEHFDPEAWADLFQKAGARSRTRCRAPTTGSPVEQRPYPWNVRSTRVPIRDIIGELATAIRKHGMRLG